MTIILKHLQFIITTVCLSVLCLTREVLIWEKSSHSSEISHLSEISAEGCISLRKSKSFIWECIHPTQARSLLNAGEVSRSRTIFLRVNSFCQDVPPRQDCSFSLDSVCFYNYYVKSAIHLIKFSSVDVCKFK